MPLVIALVVLPTASSSVRIWAASPSITGHLGDALGVVGDRAEGVHRDDDTDRGQQTTAGQRDREQGDDTGAADQEGAVHGGRDHQRGVDGGLEADRDTGQDDGRGTVGEVLPTSWTGLSSVPVK